MASEHELQRLAARQHGLAARSQLLDLGYTDRQIDARAASRRWSRAARAVYNVAPASVDTRRALHAAVLASGGLASHRSAALLHGLVDRAPAKPELLVTRATLPRGLDATIRRSRTIGPKDRTRVDGIAATSVMRTLLDLGAVVDDATLSQAVSRGLVANKTTVRRLLAAIDAGPRMGQRGVAPLRRVVELYRIDRAACESALESLLADAVAKRRLPTHRQHRVRVGANRYRLDVAWPEQMVFVEVDGLAEHTERSVFDRDRRRQNELVASGWLPLRYTWTDITHRPDEVVAEIMAVLASRTR